jgi:hypothetical protein
VVVPRKKADSGAIRYGIFSTLDFSRAALLGFNPGALYGLLVDGAMVLVADIANCFYPSRSGQCGAEEVDNTGSWTTPGRRSAEPPGGWEPPALTGRWVEDFAAGVARRR